MLRKIFVTAIISTLVLSCASAKVKLLEKSSRKRPKWIITLPEDSKNLYFLGSKSKAASYEKGVSSALNQAMTEVMKHIGFTFTLQTEITTLIKGDQDLSTYMDKINETGQVELKGQRVKEIYFEKYRDTKKVTENNITRSVEEIYYDVYLLLKYSKKEIKAERRKKEEKDRENQRLARGYKEEGEELLLKGRVMDTYNKYADIIKTLSSQSGVPLFNEGLTSVKNIAENIIIKEVPSKARKEISFKVTHETADGSSPVSRVNVSSEILMGEGEVDRLVSTGLDGIGNCKIQKMKFTGGLAKIKFTVEPGQFIFPLMDTALSNEEKDAVVDTVKMKSIIVTLKSSQYGTSKVCVIIWEKNGGRNKEMESMITRALTNNGISVVIPKSLTSDLSYKNFDNPDFYTKLSEEKISTAVIGQTEAADNGKIYTMQSVLGIIDARVVDIKNHQVLTTISKSIPKAGISFAQAKTRSFEALAESVTPTIVDTVSAE